MKGYRNLEFGRRKRTYKCYLYNISIDLSQVVYKISFLFFLRNNFICSVFSIKKSEIPIQETKGLLFFNEYNYYFVCILQGFLKYLYNKP